MTRDTHFIFRLNRSFLRYPNHPITVPRSEVDYATLAADELDQGEFRIILPKGERFLAKMYSGVSSYGPYLQLKFSGDERQLPKYLK